MTWEARIREAAYTSPSGLRLPFQYEDVGNKIKKRTKAFEFPDADGTFIQQLGVGGRRYPMKIIFSGADHDLEADTFDVALLESGIGKLEHPMYGLVDVVPVGNISRADALRSAANQTIITVTFWETTGLVYPTAGTSPSTAVTAAVARYREEKAIEFKELTPPRTVSEEAVAKNKYQRLLDDATGGYDASGRATGGLAKIAETQEDVEKQFNAVVSSINLGIDALIGDPLTLAFQTSILIQAPARATALIGARLAAYGELMNSIIGGAEDTASDFRTSDLYASGYVSGSVVSVVNNEFETKTEALEAAMVILDQMQALIVWRDANLTGFDIIDPGAAYQQLQEAVATAAGYLVEISFTLKQERRMVTTEPRTIIDLAAQLYGEVDGKLDFLINSNSLTGSEILEVPKGREIVYYV
jgi:hypothetical protein